MNFGDCGPQYPSRRIIYVNGRYLLCDATLFDQNGNCALDMFKQSTPNSSNKLGKNDLEDLPLIDLVSAVNKSLLRHVSMTTFNLLKPFWNEATIPLINQYRQSGMIHLVADLYHTELRAAKEDKGDALTTEELGAAMEVLACVLQLNHAVDKNDFEKTMQILCKPEAFWDGVVCHGSENQQKLWSKLYLKAMRDRREEKILAEMSPLLSHHEIQEVILECNTGKFFSCHNRNLNSPNERNAVGKKVPKITIDEASEVENGTDFGSNSSSQVKPIRQTDISRKLEELLNCLSQNNPSVTYKSIVALVASDEVQLPEISPDYPDIYHSFLLFSWQQWLQRNGSHNKIVSPVKSFPTYLVLVAIHRANSLLSRMFKRGRTIKCLNKTLDEGKPEKILLTLKNADSELSHALQMKQKFSEAESKEQKLLNPVTMAYINTIIQHRAQKSSFSYGHPRETGYLSHIIRGTTPAGAYLESICSQVPGSGWVWTSVPAVDEVVFRMGNKEENYILSRCIVPFFYNVHTDAIVRWPITSTQPSMTTIWTQNLSHIRWPLGFHEPPSLDPKLLNLEDCIAIVHRVNRMTDAGECVSNCTTSTPESMIPSPRIEDDTQFIIAEAIDRNFTEDSKYELPVINTTDVTDDMFAPLPTSHNIQQIPRPKQDVIRSATRIQAQWRRHQAFKSYRDRLAFFQSPTCLNAIITIQKHWRRVLAQKHYKIALLTHRRRLRLISKLQAIVRGKATRRSLKQLYELAYEARSSREREQLDGMKNVARYIHLLDGRNSRVAYDKQMSCFLLCKSLSITLKQLIDMNQELESSDRLIQLLIRIRQPIRRSDAKKQDDRIEPNLMEIQRCAHNSTQLETAFPTWMESYSPLCHLLYTQPDYMAKVLEIVPFVEIWSAANCRGITGLYEYKLTPYGSALERLIFALYRYGASHSDYLKLMHLFSRLIHVTMVTRTNDIVDSVKEVDHMLTVFQLAVSFARLKIQAALNQTTHIDTESSRCSRNLREVFHHLVVAIQKIDNLEIEQVCEEEPTKADPAMKLPHPVADLYETDPHVAVTSDNSEVKPISSVDLQNWFTNQSQNTPKIASIENIMPELFQALNAFFHNIFVNAALPVIPPCLKYIIREVYKTLRHVSPTEPEKVHLKFIGENLLHRFFVSYLLAPDLLLGFRNHQGKSISSPLPLNEFRSNSQMKTNRKKRHFLPSQLAITTKQRRTLAVICRLLYFVVTNKGYSESSNTTIEHHGEQSSLADLLNPCIRRWHGQFRSCIQQIVQSPRIELSDRMDDNLISMWLRGPEALRETPCIVPDKNNMNDQEEQRRLTNEESVGVVLKAGELFELHRLLLENQSSIAPCPSDPLHVILKNLGDLPRPINDVCNQKSSDYSERSSTYSKNWKHRNLSMDFPHPVNNLCQLEPMKDLDIMEENQNQNTRRIGNAGTTNFLIDMNIQYYKPRKNRHHEASIHASQNLLVRPEPVNEFQALIAYFYGASMAFLSSTACPPMPFRCCHQHLTCAKCQSDLAIRPFQLIAGLASRSTVSALNHPRNDSVSGEELDNNHQYCIFDWLEARKLLAMIFKKLRYIGNFKQSSHFPRLGSCSTLLAWLKQFEPWLVMESRRLVEPQRPSLFHVDKQWAGDNGTSRMNHDEYKTHLRDMKSSVCLLKTSLQKLCDQGFVTRSKGYNELVEALARDIIHLRSKCNLSAWEQLEVELRKMISNVKKELQDLDHRANVYAAHALECLLPTKKIKNELSRSAKACDSSYGLILNAARMRKLGLLSSASNKPVKWINTTHLHVTPLCENTSQDTSSDQDSGQASSENRPRTPQLIPGMFELRAQTSNGLMLHRAHFSLLELLCQHQQGVTSFAIMDNLSLNLGPFIQIILDTFYIEK